MPIETDDLPKLAMTFAHEVLGWDKAVFHEKLPHRMILKEEYGPNPPEMFGYDYGQIDDVFPILRQWCQEHDDLGFTLHFTRRGNYIVTIQDEGYWPLKIIAQSEESKSASYAMLAACLEASHKLRINP